MSKGMVMKIDQGWAVIFTSDCEMIRVKWQPGMVAGREIELDIVQQQPRNTVSTMHGPANVRTQAGAQKPARRRPLWQLASAAAMVIILLTAGFILIPGLFTPAVYAQVAVDMNPSVAFDLDKTMHVQAVHALNTQAGAILADQEQTYIGLDWQVAVAQWVVDLRTRPANPVHQMLLSAVLPDQATGLRTQLLALAGEVEQMNRASDPDAGNDEYAGSNSRSDPPNQPGMIGALDGLACRVIYSTDTRIIREAQRNNLSIGRQMLLNQAHYQHEAWDAAGIAAAPLGDLIQALLPPGETDQTYLTEETPRPLSDTAPSPTSDSARPATPGTSSQQTSATHTGRQTSQNQSGSQHTSQNGSQNSSQNGSQFTSQNGSQDSGQHTSQDGGQGTKDGTTGPTGSQQTSRGTNHQTSQPATSASEGQTTSSQQTSRATSQAASQATSPATSNQSGTGGPSGTGQGGTCSQST